MFEPITLIAELHAHAIDLELRDGTLYVVGDTSTLSPTLNADLDQRWPVLAAALSTERSTNHVDN